MRNKLLPSGFIVIALIAIAIVWYSLQLTPESKLNIVLENEEDYTKIAEIYYEDFQNNNDTTDRFVYSTGKSGRIFCSTESGYRELDLTDEELASSIVVYASYQMDDNKGLDRIYVYNNFVSFCTVNGCESLVYSVNGKRPKHINTPDENFYHISIFKITDHWYYLTGDQKI